MKLKPVDLKKAKEEWEWDGRPYLVKYGPEYFVSYPKHDYIDRIYFDDVKHKTIVFLDEVEELAIITT